MNAFLPFAVRNPSYTSAPISIRQLLVHTSSIDDGPSYGGGYVCGDAQATLGDWLRGYLIPGGVHYDPGSNFHKWAPGTKYSYSNIAYSVLGLLIEHVSGVEYARYCQRNIFAPLAMMRTRFHLQGVASAAQAIPYSFSKSDDFAAPALRGSSSSPATGDGAARQLPYCLYSYPTLADGSARSTAADMAKFVAMCAGGGALNGVRLLRAETMALMLSDQAAPITPGDGRRQGLAWVEYRNETWGKYGGDPGIATLASFRLKDRRGVVILTNSDRGEGVTNAIAKQVFDFAA